MTREKAVMFIEELEWFFQLRMQTSHADELHQCNERLVLLLTDDAVPVSQKRTHDPVTGLMNPLP